MFGCVNEDLINSTKFFRFKKCLEAGMKPSWVLSDEERNRRFNKFNKLQLKSPNSDKTLATAAARKSANIRVPELYITFTMEEQKLIGFIKNKMNFCQQSWLRNLLNYGNFSLLIKRECILNCWIAQFSFTSQDKVDKNLFDKYTGCPKKKCPFSPYYSAS